MLVTITREGATTSAIIDRERQSDRADENSGPQERCEIARPAGGLHARSTACTLPVADRAVPSLRAFVRDAALGWELSDDTIYTLRVITTELVTNVLRHSGSPDVTVMVAVDRPTVTIEVSDSGRWRARRRATPSQNEEAEGGRGLSLVRAYSTTCRVRKTSRGTTVCVEVDDEPSPAPPTAHDT